MLVARQSVDSAATAAEPLPAPQASSKPNSNDFVGLTKCAACHFKEYQTWKTSAHAKTASYLPVKYRNNDECMGCHSGYHGSGRPDPANAQLTGVACENCHGPGRQHADFALSLMNQKAEPNDETLTQLRSKIDRTSLSQCIRCHLSQAHKKHPEYDRDAILERREANSANNPGAPRRIFQVH